MNTLTSLELKQLLKGDITNKDISSLFITWALKGYIVIMECDKHYILKKKKDITATERMYEISFFNTIFKQSNSINLFDLFGTMYLDFQKVYLGVKKELAQKQPFTNKLPLLLLQATIGIIYAFFLFSVTNNILVSLFVGVFYLLPHTFASYILQTQLEGNLHKGNAVWAGIIYVSFIVITFGINTFGTGASLYPVATIILASICTGVLGHQRYKLASKHTKYDEALTRQKYLVKSTELHQKDIVDLILLQYKKEQSKITINDYTWTNFTEKDIKLITKLDKMITKLGAELAPNPLPSGTIAASK